MDGGGERNRTAAQGFAVPHTAPRNPWSHPLYRKAGSEKGAIGERDSGHLRILTATNGQGLMADIPAT